MYIALQKIHKDKDAKPTEFEENVAQALFDLENTNQEIKSDLKDLYINSALWLHKLRDNAGKNIGIMLVGDKSNLESQRDVPTEDAKEFVQTKTL